MARTPNAGILYHAAVHVSREEAEKVKIKASYEDEKELAHLLEKLKPDVTGCRPKPAKGRYKRAYITMKCGERSRKSAENDPPKGAFMRKNDP